jgi:hypothetical protein
VTRSLARVPTGDRAIVATGDSVGLPPSGVLVDGSGYQWI